MYKWAIKNHTQNKFVRDIHPNCTVNASSFTHDILKAKQFRSQESAQRECCGDESPVNISDLFTY
jgi:hypothetical protein